VLSLLFLSSSFEEKILLVLVWLASKIQSDQVGCAEALVNNPIQPDRVS
jgi:hypothetical protein